MLTKKELAEEKSREKNYNKISEFIISKTAFGKFYGLMRMASKAGEGMIKHKICIDKNGRILKIYKSKTGKWIGTFLKPAHEMMSRDLSQKKYGRAVLDLFGFGGFIDHKEMKHAKCFIIKPNLIVKKEDRHTKGIENLEKKVKKGGLGGLYKNCNCKK
jgi:hypothetical protein